MDHKEMIKQAALGISIEETEKTAIQPMLGGAAPAEGIPPPGGMDPMAGGGAPAMPPMPGGGAPLPMDPAMMGGMPPMDPAAGGMPMDPSMLGLPPEGEAPPEEAPAEEAPVEEDVNDPLTDVDGNAKPDTMVPLEGIKDFTVGVIEATKGKKTQEAAPAEAGGGDPMAEGPAAAGASIGGAPAADPMSAMPKIGEILDSIEKDLQ